MPIYERRCEECQHQGEHFEKLEAPEGIVYDTCPACGKEGIYKRLISAMARTPLSWEKSCRGD